MRDLPNHGHSGRRTDARRGVFFSRLVRVSGRRTRGYSARRSACYGQWLPRRRPTLPSSPSPRSRSSATSPSAMKLSSPLLLPSSNSFLIPGRVEEPEGHTSGLRVGEVFLPCFHTSPSATRCAPRPCRACRAPSRPSSSSGSSPAAVRYRSGSSSASSTWTTPMDVRSPSRRCAASVRTWRTCSTSSRPLSVPR